MDRRQRKTREAIFAAFIQLLAKKDFARITVGEIIALADVGRATFYAHFETKDHLLKELCEDLFCHILDAANGAGGEHRHLFGCEGTEEVFLHLFRHLLKNDNHILDLLSCPSSDLFLRCFEARLRLLAAERLQLFDGHRSAALPESLRVRHIASTFVDTLRWWLEGGMRESPETVTEYFMLAV